MINIEAAVADFIRWLGAPRAFFPWLLPSDTSSHEISHLLRELVPPESSDRVIKQFLTNLQNTIKFTSRIIQKRGLRTDDAQATCDVVSLLRACAKFNSKEPNENFRIGEKEVLSLLVSLAVRYDPSSKHMEKEQREQITEALAELSNSNKGIYRSKELASGVVDLVSQISLVSEISLPMKLAAMDMSLRESTVKLRAYTHMIAEATKRNRMPLYLRGILKCVQVKQKIDDANQKIASLPADFSDALPACFPSIAPELQAVYLPLMQALRLSALPAEIEDLICQLEHHEEYNKVYNVILDIARASLPANLARQVRDFDSAQGLLRDFFDKNVKKWLIPPELEHCCSFKFRLKTPKSLVYKLLDKIRKQEPLDISDITAVRIITEPPDEQGEKHNSNPKHQSEILGRLIQHLDKTLQDPNSQVLQLTPANLDQLLPPGTDPRRIYYVQPKESTIQIESHREFYRTPRPPKPSKNLVEPVTLKQGKEKKTSNKKKKPPNLRGKRDIRGFYSGAHDTVAIVFQQDGSKPFVVVAEVQYSEKVCREFTDEFDPHVRYLSDRSGSLPFDPEQLVEDTVSVRVRQKDILGHAHEQIVRLSLGATFADVAMEVFGERSPSMAFGHCRRLHSHNAPLHIQDDGVNDYAQACRTPAMVGDIICFEPAPLQSAQELELRRDVLTTACRLPAHRKPIQSPSPTL